MSEDVSLLARSLGAQFPDTAAEDLLAYTAGDWLPEGETDRLRIYAQAKVQSVHEMVSALGSVEDEEELYSTLAFFWVELKTEWNRYNSVMNYQLFRNGQAEPSVMARGTLGSAVLARFESLLTPPDLAGLTEVAAQPLEVGRPDVSQLRRFLERHARAVNVIGKAVSLAAEAGAQTSQLVAEADDLKALDLEVLWPSIRERVQHAVGGDRPFTVDATWGYGTAIDPKWIDGLVDGLTTWMSTTLASQDSPDARVAAGLSAHLAFTVNVVVEAGVPQVTGTWAGGPAPEAIQVPEPALA